MTNQEMIKEMFTLQQKLNDDTNGKGWEKGYTQYNRIINWRRCIYMESAELIDSFNWKHWKDINIDPNWENAKVELADIWHFILSLGLELYKNERLGDINQIAHDVSHMRYFDEFCKEALQPEKEDAFSIISVVEYLMKNSLNHESFSRLSDDFFLVAIECGLNLEELYKLYIAKNVLNGFRQNNGYKEGTYIKTWNTQEDNEVMLEILEDGTLNAQELYNQLEKKYQTISK